MIVRERAQHFVMISQHDHAQLSGWCAMLWGNERIPAPPVPRDALYLAASLHDVGWLALDANPAWNEAAGRPYTFVDLPNALRLPHYRRGIDFVERLDPYAALLCSQHYVSLLEPELNAAGEEAKRFVVAERRRQHRLVRRLREAGRDQELRRNRYDLSLLKIWDALSLYVALNEPGVAKSAEHPWYRDRVAVLPSYPDVAPSPGASAGAGGDTGAGTVLRARWLSGTDIGLQPFPFRETFTYALLTKEVAKPAVREWGIVEAYRWAPTSIQLVRFVPDPGD